MLEELEIYEVDVKVAAAPSEAPPATPAPAEPIVLDPVVAGLEELLPDLHSPGPVAPPPLPPPLAPPLPVAFMPAVEPAPGAYGWRTLVLPDDLGRIQYHRTKRRINAHRPCKAHWQDNATCKMDRSGLEHPVHPNGQGRPLGLLIAWLDICVEEKWPDRETHNDVKAWFGKWDGYGRRLAAREWYG